MTATEIITNALGGIILLGILVAYLAHLRWRLRHGHVPSRIESAVFFMIVTISLVATIAHGLRESGVF